MTDSETVAAIAELMNLLVQSKTHDERCEANEYGICACAHNETRLSEVAIERVGVLNRMLRRDETPPPPSMA